MTTVGEKTIEAAAISGAFLWPIGVTLELYSGSYMWPAAAIGAALLVGGGRPFWAVPFQTFLRGYLAGGAVYGIGIYTRTDKYALKVTFAEAMILNMFNGGS